MPRTLFENNIINTTLLCDESREYLKNLRNLSEDKPLSRDLPATLNWEELYFLINADGEEEPYQDKPQRRREILDNLIQFENNHKQECESHHQQAQNKAKSLRNWTIGIGLTTLLLLTAAALLVIFFPPAATLILPFFAAIGSWSPLLVLNSFLPSVGLAIASLVARGSRNAMKTTLDRSNDLLNQLEEDTDRILRDSTSEQNPSPTSLLRPTSELSNSKHATRFGNIFSEPAANQSTAPVNENQADLTRASSSPSLPSP